MAAPKRASIPKLSWHEAHPAPIVLVSGPEDLLAERAVASIRAALAAQDPSLEVSDLDAQTAASGDLTMLASPSLFAEPRLVRVDNVEHTNDAFLDEALRYIAMPSDAVVVLRHRSGVRGKKLLDAVRGGAGGGIEVVCAEVKRDQDRVDFAAGEFRSAGRRATPGAVRTLVQAFQGDLAELAAACRQLVSDVQGDIDESRVETYYAGRVEITAFAVVDAALAGRRGESLIRLRQAVASGADPVPIVAAIAMKLRTMAKIQDAGGSNAAIASQAGLAPWQVQRARNDLQGWGETGLGRCIMLTARTDEQLKTGTRDPLFAVERLVDAIAARGTSA